MNELMHVMQEQIDACNAIMIFGVHGWSFQSSSLVKSWVQNRVSIVKWVDMAGMLANKPKRGKDVVSGLRKP